ncbi:hypothetical protein [Aquabacterium sp.]|uniref:hypothetical protein n=1 Tax=Aquabacterium sp. TaxID=1872578 RepID=UPI004037801B
MSALMRVMARLGEHRLSCLVAQQSGRFIRVEQAKKNAARVRGILMVIAPG